MHITKPEALALYGDVPLKFSSYYKYCFTFVGMAPDGARIVATIGGSSDDIYKFNCEPETITKLNHEPAMAQITKDGREIYSHSEF